MKKDKGKKWSFRDKKLKKQGEKEKYTRLQRFLLYLIDEYQRYPDATEDIIEALLIILLGAFLGELLIIWGFW